MTLTMGAMEAVTIPESFVYLGSIRTKWARRKRTRASTLLTRGTVVFALKATIFLLPLGHASGFDQVGSSSFESMDDFQAYTRQLRGSMVRAVSSDVKVPFLSLRDENRNDGEDWGSPLDGEKLVERMELEENDKDIDWNEECDGYTDDWDDDWFNPCEKMASSSTTITPSFSSLYPRCNIERSDYIGDGFCDPMWPYNTAQCGWDGGDCCRETCGGKYGCNEKFVCKDPRYGSHSVVGNPEKEAIVPTASPTTNCVVPSPHYLGDGFCDSESPYNTEECEWDGGDCCKESCFGREGCVQEFVCLDPKFSNEDSVTIIQTEKPTLRPTPRPSPRPTTRPTGKPTAGSTTRPTRRPTLRPTLTPTLRPTAKPTPGPTTKPTLSATAQPTPIPTKLPTLNPTKWPTLTPTAPPTLLPAPEPMTIPPITKTENEIVNPIKPLSFNTSAEFTSSPMVEANSIHRTFSPMTASTRTTWPADDAFNITDQPTPSLTNLMSTAKQPEILSQGPNSITRDKESPSIGDCSGITRNIIDTGYEGVRGTRYYGVMFDVRTSFPLSNRAKTVAEKAPAIVAFDLNLDGGRGYGTGGDRSYRIHVFGRSGTHVGHQSSGADGWTDLGAYTVSPSFSHKAGNHADAVDSRPSYRLELAEPLFMAPHHRIDTDEVLVSFYFAQEEMDTGAGLRVFNKNEEGVWAVLASDGVLDVLVGTGKRGNGTLFGGDDDEDIGFSGVVYYDPKPCRNATLTPDIANIDGSTEGEGKEEEEEDEDEEEEEPEPEPEPEPEAEANDFLESENEEDTIENVGINNNTNNSPDEGVKVVRMSSFTVTFVLGGMTQPLAANNLTLDFSEAEEVVLKEYTEQFLGQWYKTAIMGYYDLEDEGLREVMQNVHTDVQLSIDGIDAVLPGKRRKLSSSVSALHLPSVRRSAAQEVTVGRTFHGYTVFRDVPSLSGSSSISAFGATAAMNQRSSGSSWIVPDAQVLDAMTQLAFKGETAQRYLGGLFLFEGVLDGGGGHVHGQQQQNQKAESGKGGILQYATAVSVEVHSQNMDGSAGDGTIVRPATSPSPPTVQRGNDAPRQSKDRNDGWDIIIPTNSPMEVEESMMHTRTVGIVVITVASVILVGLVVAFVHGRMRKRKKRRRKTKKKRQQQGGSKSGWSGGITLSDVLARPRNSRRSDRRQLCDISTLEDDSPNRHGADHASGSFIVGSEKVGDDGGSSPVGIIIDSYKKRKAGRKGNDHDGAGSGNKDLGQRRHRDSKNLALHHSSSSRLAGGKYVGATVDGMNANDECSSYGWIGVGEDYECESSIEPPTTIGTGGDDRSTYTGSIITAGEYQRHSSSFEEVWGGEKSKKSEKERNRQRPSPLRSISGTTLQLDMSTGKSVPLETDYARGSGTCDGKSEIESTEKSIAGRTKDDKWRQRFEWMWNSDEVFPTVSPDDNPSASPAPESPEKVNRTSLPEGFFDRTYPKVDVAAPPRPPRPHDRRYGKSDTR